MKPAPASHIDFLDPLRGVAILAVFVYHALWGAFGLDQLPWGTWFRDFNVPASFLPFLPFTFGWMGVAIFFVVSGFCIHLSFARQPDWPLFFHRRFFRIYPPYVAVLLFFVLLFPSTSFLSKSGPNWTQFLSHFFLFHNFSARTFYGINPSLWSIAVEVQLYAIYPLLLWLTRRSGWRATMTGLAVLETALRLTDGFLLTRGGSGLPTWLGASPFIYWFSWSLGALLAERYLRGESIRIPRHAATSFAVLAVGCNFIKPLAPLSFPLFALSTAAVVGRRLQSPPASRAAAGFWQRHLAQVGVWSFSLYLLHQPLVVMIPRVAARILPEAWHHPVLFFVLSLGSWVVVVPLARLSYLYCELPAIALGKRLHTARVRSLETAALHPAVASASSAAEVRTGPPTS